MHRPRQALDHDSYVFAYVSVSTCVRCWAPETKPASGACRPVPCVTTPVCLVLLTFVQRTACGWPCSSRPSARQRNGWLENSTVGSLQKPRPTAHGERDQSVNWGLRRGNPLNEFGRAHDFSGFPALCNTEGEPTNAGTDYSKPPTFGSSRGSRPATTPSSHSKGPRMPGRLPATTSPKWGHLPP